MLSVKNQLNNKVVTATINRTSIEFEKAIMTEVKKNISKLWLTEKEKQEAIENANCSKVCDLEDTIAIEYVA